jgi:hypothetical protein
MQKGDLAVHHREQLVVILEGVLCHVTVTSGTKRRLRRSDPDTYHISWHEIPLKRMVTIGERWPDYEVEIVTFISKEVAGQAAEFLLDAEIPYSSIRYHSYNDFVNTLRYRPHVRAVYDSNYQRLSEYGQAGTAVVRGEDW